MIEWLAKNIKGDRTIWGVVIILSVFGILAVYSSTGTLAYAKKSGNTEYYLMKHLGILVLGLSFMWVAHMVDFQYYSRLSQLFLWLSIPLLIYTLMFGKEVNDATRWITIPVIGMSFQTSDLAKLALIMYIARFLSKKQDNIKSFKESFLPILIYIVVICGLIAPSNLSTAAVLFATCMLLLFIGRIPFTYLLSLAATGIIVLAISIGIILNTPGQGRVATWKSRIETYVSFVKGDEQAESYQNQQAKIAISKGGITGMGPGNSTQRNFLPSPYADFIYAIIIEEYGLVGGGVLILLYLILLFRTIRIVMLTPKAFGALLAVGLSFSLVIQAFINMAVAVHMVPNTGLPLPLVSMGGTSLFFTSMAFGIIISVSRATTKEKPQTDESIEA
jgi:cell division protein FtsW